MHARLSGCGGLALTASVRWCGVRTVGRVAANCPTFHWYDSAPQFVLLVPPVGGGGFDRLVGWVEYMNATIFTKCYRSASSLKFVRTIIIRIRRFCDVWAEDDDGVTTCPSGTNQQEAAGWERTVWRHFRPVQTSMERQRAGAWYSVDGGNQD